MIAPPHALQAEQGNCDGPSGKSGCTGSSVLFVALNVWVSLNCCPLPEPYSQLGIYNSGLLRAENTAVPHGHDCEPGRRERALRGAAGRKSRWLDRRWRISSLGNSFVNTDEHNITIFQNGDGSWGGRLTEKAAGRFVTARRRYESEAKAKLAAFDGMIFLKDRRGWDG
ncbi:hypothetical protein [Bradyrhizobium sp. USDA 3364]